MFTVSDVRIAINKFDLDGDEGHEVTLWYVHGIDTYYPSKLAAEAAARAVFFDETESQRYNRIYSALFWRAK